MLDRNLRGMKGKRKEGEKGGRGGEESGERRMGGKEESRRVSQERKLEHTVQLGCFLPCRCVPGNNLENCGQQFDSSTSTNNTKINHLIYIS